MCVSCFLHKAKPAELSAFTETDEVPREGHQRFWSRSENDISQGFTGLVPWRVRHLSQRGHKGHVHVLQKRTGFLCHHTQTPT